jgi:hypothetical protein
MVNLQRAGPHRFLTTASLQAGLDTAALLNECVFHLPAKGLHGTGRFSISKRGLNRRSTR